MIPRMRTDLDAAITALASRQANSFSRSQVLDLGISPGLIHRRVRSKRWSTVHRGVYRLPGADPGWVGALWAASLRAGPSSWVSHEAAGQVHELDGGLAGQTTLSVPHGLHLRID